MTPEYKNALAQLAHLTVLLWDRLPARQLSIAYIDQTQGNPHLALEHLIAHIAHTPIPLHEIETKLLTSLWDHFQHKTRGNFPTYTECRPGTRCGMHGYYDDPQMPNPGRDSFSETVSSLQETP